MSSVSVGRGVIPSSSRDGDRQLPDPRPERASRCLGRKVRGRRRQDASERLHDLRSALLAEPGGQIQRRTDIVTGRPRKCPLVGQHGHPLDRRQLRHSARQFADRVYV